MTESFEDILNEPDEDASGTETSASTATTDETPVVAEETEEVVETTPDPVSEGYTQDARGVWHRKDGTIASKEEVAGFGAAKSSPEGGVVIPGPASDASVAAAVVETPATPLPAFRYRAVGQTHDLAGATFDPATGKVTMEGDAVGTIRQALNAQHVLPQYQSRVAELERQVQTQGPSEARADALAKSLTGIIQNPNDEEAIVAFLTLRQNFPSMIAKAEADYWKQQAMGGQRQQETERPQASLPAPEELQTATGEYIEQFKLDNEFRAMTESDWQQIGQSLARKPYAFLRPATAEDAKNYGVTQGEQVYDTDALAEEVREYQKRAQVAREAEAKVKKTQEAARFNQQQIPTQPKPKPAAQRSTAPAAAGKEARKDWDTQFKDAWTARDDDEQ